MSGNLLDCHYIRMAGHNFVNPVNIEPLLYVSSVHSILLVTSIIDQVPFEFDTHVNAVAWLWDTGNLCSTFHLLVMVVVIHLV